MLERQCLFCGSLFIPTKKHPAKVYCSRGCVMRKNAIAQRLPPFNCKWCGKQFISTNGNAQYCSQICSGYASQPLRTIRPVEVRFWEKVDKTDYCWNWTGLLSTHGYGILSVMRRYVIASRFSWKLHFGDPGASHVLHKCDNPKCVNPEHLFLGTHQDNMADMVKKNRHHHGETHRSHKLTETDVRAIRASSAAHSVLAKQFGVGQSVISRIRARKAWRHIE